MLLWQNIVLLGDKGLNSKRTLVGSIVVAIFLAIFIIDKASTERDKPKISEPISEKKSDDSYTLTKPGQKMVGEHNTHELLKIKTINEELHITPVKITIEDIKVFGVSETRGEDWNYLQIEYQSESTIDKTVDWNGITTIITDKGEELDAIAQDLTYTDNVGSIHELGVVREHVIAVKVEDPHIDKVELAMAGTSERDSDVPKISNGMTVEFNIN